MGFKDESPTLAQAGNGERVVCHGWRTKFFSLRANGVAGCLYTLTRRWSRGGSDFISLLFLSDIMKTNIPRTIQPIDYSRLDQRLVKAARGMEANFMKQMVRTMRKSVQESPETKANQGLQLFRGMLDDKYADSAAGQGGIGIADMIIRHLLEKSGSMQAPVSKPIAIQNENDSVGIKDTVKGKTD